MRRDAAAAAPTGFCSISEEAQADRTQYEVRGGPGGCLFVLLFFSMLGMCGPSLTCRGADAARGRFWFIIQRELQACVRACTPMRQVKVSSSSQSILLKDTRGCQGNRTRDPHPACAVLAPLTFFAHEEMFDGPFVWERAGLSVLLLEP